MLSLLYDSCAETTEVTTTQGLGMATVGPIARNCPMKENLYYYNYYRFITEALLCTKKILQKFQRLKGAAFFSEL